MRFVVELTDGVTTKVGLVGSTTKATSFAQSIGQVKDILQANGLDIGVTFYGVTMANNVPGTSTARLYFESSMQNEDASNSMWEAIGDSGGLDLSEAIDKTFPCQFVMSSVDDIGRYLRWRLEIEEATPAITLTVIFKVTVLGRG